LINAEHRRETCGIRRIERATAAWRHDFAMRARARARNFWIPQRSRASRRIAPCDFRFVNLWG